MKTHWPAPGATKEWQGLHLTCCHRMVRPEELATENDDIGCTTCQRAVMLFASLPKGAQSWLT